MSRLIIIAMMILSMLSISAVSALDTDTTTTDISPMTITQTNGAPLLLSTVKATDAQKVTLIFNQAIQVTSLRVRIIDQATNENVKVASITGSLDPMAAIITTTSTLTAGASYILTITSALSTTDMTISTGIDSIREFAVPVTLSGTSLNAPSNPSAVIIATGTTISNPKPTTQSGSATGAIRLPQNNTETLPVTGVPATILIIISAISALGLLFFRKRA